MAELLALYLHWPFCKSKCPYCDFNSHVREGIDAAAWQRALLAELEHMASWVKERELVSIFFGGGTPSLMPPEIAKSLIARAKALWPHAGDMEITLEANPTSVEAEKFSAFAKAGVNRVSLGVQSLRQDALAFLGREHNAAEAKQAIALAADYFPRYSFDLIYARPAQTLSQWEEELGEALTLTRGHLSLYQLTVEENTAFHALYKKGGFALPGEDLAAELFERTQEMTRAHGLAMYEISNHAAPGQESRHNLAYWRGEDYLGVGPGAHGRVTRNDGARIATATFKSPERWLERVERDNHALEIFEPVDAMHTAEEWLMMGLRITGGIALARYRARTGIDLRALAEQRWQHLRDRGLLEWNETHLRATPQGMLLLTALTATLAESL